MNTHDEYSKNPEVLHATGLSERQFLLVDRTIRASVKGGRFKSPAVAIRRKNVVGSDKNGKARITPIRKTLYLKSQVSDDALQSFLLAILSQEIQVTPQTTDAELIALAKTYARRQARPYEKEKFVQPLDEDKDADATSAPTQPWDDISIGGKGKYPEWQRIQESWGIETSNSSGRVKKQSEACLKVNRIEGLIGQEKTQWALEYASSDYTKTGTERSKFSRLAATIRNGWKNAGYEL